MSTELGPTGPTGPTETVAESTGSHTSGTGPESILLSDLSGGTPPPPVISLSELLSDISVLQQQENDDRDKFVAVTSPSLSGFRSNLISWIAGGKQGACDLIRMTLSPPNVCSDGVSRNLFEYIQFLSGKSIVDHVQSIQAILPDFEIGYRCSRTELVFCVVSVKV